MNLKHLRFFVTLADELHFGRAAERLGMTQPPLSHAIALLERELGVRLFNRSKRHVELTPAGRQLVDHVRTIVDQADGLPSLARKYVAGEIGTLSIGFVSTSDYSILPGLIAAYGGAYESVRLSLHEMTTDVQIRAVLDGSIDVGLIIPGKAALHTSLAYAPLLAEPLIAAVPEGWVSSGRVTVQQGKVDLKQLLQNPLLLFPRANSPAFHDIITGFLADRQITIVPGQEAIQVQTIVSLVSAGLGVALVPGSLQRLAREGARYYELTDRSPLIETGLVWRKDDQSPALEHFVAIARRLNGRNSDV